MSTTIEKFKDAGQLQTELEIYTSDGVVMFIKPQESEEGWKIRFDETNLEDLIDSLIIAASVAGIKLTNY